MSESKFEKECRFIPDSEDDPKAFVQVATITNTSQRIVRVVCKGLYSLTIEVMNVEHGRYQWTEEHCHIGIDELLTMAKAIKTLPEEEEEVKNPIVRGE
jgi:Iap family predicted aminopeptidase